MAKLTDRLKEKMLNEVLTETDIDRIMESEKYYPSESENDNETEEGVLKYSNGKSEVWVKHIFSGGEYLVEDVTIKTKKSGSTRGRHLTPEEIKAFMDYFRENGKYDEFMIFVMELFLARRIGDTVCLEWKQFYYENGNKRKIINDLVEEKTEKIARLHIPDIVWKYIDWYCGVKNANSKSQMNFGTEPFHPAEHLSEDIFAYDQKDKIEKYIPGKNEYTSAYKRAVISQSKAFRYQFNLAREALGIKDVNTHSIRKTFGHIAHMLNQFDPDCLDVLQSIYVHDSKETTKIYIDIIDDKAKGYFNDVANFVSEIDLGNKPCIENTPVIALKINDLRSILLKAYNFGMENSSEQNANIHMEIMNVLLSDVEKIRV